MRELLYALRFTGQATPVGEVGHVLKVTTTAPSATLTSSVGPAGLSSALEPASGEAATFASEVTFTGATSFQEVGTIGFGDGHWLRFSTVGSGYLAPSADPSRKHSSVTWRVDGGEGQFAGVTGLITSNFFVDDRLRVVDHHFGVVLVSEIAIQHRADKQAIAPCEKRKRTEAPPGGATIKERSGG